MPITTVKAQKAVTQLAAAIQAILKSQQRPRLEAIAKAAGVPFDGAEWPHLDTLRAILRDFASGSASR